MRQYNHNKNIFIYLFTIKRLFARLLVKAASKKELAKASPGKRIDLIAVVSDLVGNEQTLHPLWRIVALPPLLYGLNVAAVPPPALLLVMVAATGRLRV